MSAIWTPRSYPVSAIWTHRSYPVSISGRARGVAGHRGGVVVVVVVVVGGGVLGCRNILGSEGCWNL